MNPSSTKNVSIDDLSRDPVDGAYHCPTCEAPFTRRSNLRRHYTIHTRSMEFRCHICSKGFARSDELNYHALQCSAAVWNEATDRMFHTMALESSDHLDYQPINFPNIPTRLPPSQFPSSFNPTASSFSPQASPGLQDERDFSEFLSSLTSSPMPDSSRLSEMSLYDLRSPQLLDSTARPTSSSSSTSQIPPTPSTSLYDPTNDMASRARPNHASHQRYHGVNGRRRTKEKPIYTRRQVDDMLDAVSNCFVGTIEEVLRRTNAQNRSQPDIGALPNASVSPTPLDSQSASRIDELRRTSRTMSNRLLTGLGAGQDDRFNEERD